MRISSKKILLIFAAIMLVVVFGKFLSILYFPDSENILEKGDPSFKLQPTLSLSQTFITDRKGFSKIEFLLRTPGPKENDVIQMEIADETCSNTIRTSKMKKSFLSDGNLYEFKFDRISDSENKKYCLKATFVPGHDNSKAIKFFTTESRDPQFALTGNTSEENFENKSLSMRTVYKNESIGQDLGELNQRISQYKPWFLKHFYLDAIVILFVALSIGLVTILILL